jgi:pectinesterase
MCGAVRPEGWHNWDQPEREKTARYAEYDSIGPGFDAAQRVKWSKQLDEEAARRITAAEVLRGPDNWDPERPQSQN